MTGKPGIGGQNRLPDYEKAVRGTLRKRRAVPRQAAPELGLPARPKWLPPKAHALFEQVSARLNDRDALHTSDGNLAGLVALALCNFIDAEASGNAPAGAEWLRQARVQLRAFGKGKGAMSAAARSAIPAPTAPKRELSAAELFWPDDPMPGDPHHPGE